VFDALSSLSFSLPGYSASTTGAPEIQIGSDEPPLNDDRFAVVARASDGLTGPSVNGNTLDTLILRMDDSTATVFNTALVLPSSLSLSSFDSYLSFFIFFAGPNGTEPTISGTVTSLSSVPEPSTFIIWALLGGIGLGFAVVQSRFSIR